MKKRSLLIIFLTVFIDLVGFGIIIPLSPYLARQFGADAVDVGLLMAIYSFMQLIFAPMWGRLSDRFGRRPIILMSLLGAGLSHLLFAFAGQLTLLFVARGLAGLFGANISTAMAYIADVTDQKSRSKGMGLIGAAFGLGFVLGPALGSYFGDLGLRLGEAPPFGHSFAAVIAAVICLGNFLGALLFLPESLSVEIRMRLPRRQSRWKLLSQFIHRPVTGKLMIMFLLSTLAMANMEASLFLLVKDDFGWTLAQAGMGFAYVGLIMVFTQGFLVRRLMPKYGERSILFTGLFIGALGFIGIGLAPSIPVMAIAVTLLGIGNGLNHPAATGSISLLSGQEEQGLVMGVNQSLAALGRILGPAFGGWLYRDLGHEFPFLLAGLLNVGAILLGLTVFAKLPSAGKEGQKESIGTEASGIGGFQLMNIIKNEVPFLLLQTVETLQIPESMNELLKGRVEKVDEEIHKFVAEKTADSSFPIVLLCEDGQVSSMKGAELVQRGYINVYYVEGGLISLKNFDPRD
ncbi:MAG: MFS transporter [Bdellovibrionales bacterium]|nr:MFS transporter [Bdellovibrionales bacterium]